MAFIVENGKMEGAIPFPEKRIVEYSTHNCLIVSCSFICSRSGKNECFMYRTRICVSANLGRRAPHSCIHFHGKATCVWLHQLSWERSVTVTFSNWDRIASIKVLSPQILR
jgi:hypothetical protein